METIGDRIREKRKQLGLTQLELAEKLNVTDRAVSKWEQGEGDPSVSLLPEIARIFDITLDYLMTGKQEFSISLDDMDIDKRAIFLIKNDDVDNFIKYGYLQKDIIFKEERYDFVNIRNNTKILNAIYENKSINIFKKCVEKSLKLNNTIGEQSKVPLINGDLDEYIKMCALSNCVDGLKQIDLKYFVIGIKTDVNNMVPFHISPAITPALYRYRSYVLAESTLDYIFSCCKTSKEVVDYMSEIEFYKDNNRKVYLMTDYIIYELYKNGLFEKLNNVITQLEEYNIFAEQIYNESIVGKYSGKKVREGAIYFTNQGEYLQAIVTPINLALNLARKNKDFVWLKKFNFYNKKLLAQIPDLKINILKDKEITLMELENDKNTPLEELLKLKYVTNNIVNIYDFLRKDYGLNKEEKSERIKEKISQIKKFEKFIKSYYFSAYELILDCLEKQDKDLLLSFSLDLGYEKLRDAVIKNDINLIKMIANKLFIPTEKELKEINGTLRYNQGKNEKFIFIELKERKFNGLVNKDYYLKLLYQLCNLPLNLFNESISLATLQEVKKQIINEQIKIYEEEYEKITQEKAIEEQYIKISTELDREYLLSELKKGEADKVVVLLCKRLQIILQHKYKLSGDLLTMIDSFINKQENEILKEKFEILHKLRMKRNNIVHAETRDFEISIEEINKCIELLDEMSQ